MRAFAGDCRFSGVSAMLLSSFVVLALFVGTGCEEQLNENEQTQEADAGGNASPSGCLAEQVKSLPAPDYGWDFADGKGAAFGQGTIELKGDPSFSGGSVELDGDDGVIFNNVSKPQNFTVSLFAKSDVSKPSQYITILGYGSSGGYTGWGIDHGDAQGTVGPAVYVQDGGSIKKRGGGTALPKGEWTHIVAVKRGQVLRLYVDGNRVVDTTYDKELTYADPADLALGFHQAGNHFFPGELSSVAVWTDGLSDSNLTTLADAPGNCP